jgi:hypothetical protein
LASVRFLRVRVVNVVWLRLLWKIPTSPPPLIVTSWVPPSIVRSLSMAIASGPPSSPTVAGLFSSVSVISQSPPKFMVVPDGACATAYRNSASVHSVRVKV